MNEKCLLFQLNLKKYYLAFLELTFRKNNMRNLFVIIMIAVLVICDLQSRVITVGSGKDYPQLTQAAQNAMPGDTILLFDSPITQGQYISDLKGTAENPIVISSGLSENVLFLGSSTGLQFSDIEYITLQNLSFEAQTGNGMNIDDGGDYSSPTHHITIENCIWYGMDATGNNDCLKMSGVDDFFIRNCKFSNGAAGGSMIDMVGCHNGLIEINRFSDGGSNCIQAKGGCREITIRRNEFIRGGQRSINIGGSTGMEFFRPLNSNFEAGSITVHSNIFWGSTAPVAFVGARYCKVFNNTIINPEKWSLRILQENNDAQLVKCSDNSVINNIFYFSNVATNPAVNIGPNTLPETFIFKNNLWYNYQNPGGNYPNLPVEESDGIVGQDPLFLSLNDSNLTPNSNSPTIGNGSVEFAFQRDFFGKTFTEPVTIGAINGNPGTTVEIEYFNGIKVYPQPARNQLTIEKGNNRISEIILYDLNGTELEKYKVSGILTHSINLKKFSSGTYFIKLIGGNNKFQIIPVNISK